MLLIQALINGVLAGGVYASFAAGLSLIFGVMGVLNIAHGELVMLGAFASVWLFNATGLDPLWSLPLSFCLMFVLGWLIQRLFLERIIGQPPVMSYILTFGLHLIIANIALLVWTADPRAITTGLSGETLSIGSIDLPVLKLITFGTALLIIGGLHALLSKTALGRSIRATAQDRNMARMVGINVRTVFAFTFALGAGVTGLAGSLVAAVRDVDVSMGLPYTILAFCVVVLGGMGYLPGALIGGLILGVVGELCTALLSPGWSGVITFSLLYLMLVLRPTGITGKGIVE